MGLSAQIDPWNDYPILGPYAVAVTGLTLASQQVIGADPARKGIWFHNPGTQNKRIIPASGAPLVGGAGGILLYPQEDFHLLQTEDSQFNVNVAWIGVTDNISDGSFTVLDFTPNTPGAPQVRPTIRMKQQIPVDSPIASVASVQPGGGIQVAAANPNRNGIQFVNSSTQNIGVCPSNIAPSIGAGSIIVLPGQTKTIIGNDRVRVNCAWLATAAGGANNALAVLSLYG